MPQALTKSETLGVNPRIIHTPATHLQYFYWTQLGLSLAQHQTPGLVTHLEHEKEHFFSQFIFIVGLFLSKYQEPRCNWQRQTRTYTILGNMKFLWQVSLQRSESRDSNSFSRVWFPLLDFSALFVSLLVVDTLNQSPSTWKQADPTLSAAV